MLTIIRFIVKCPSIHIYGHITPLININKAVSALESPTKMYFAKDTEHFEGSDFI